MIELETFFYTPHASYIANAARTGLPSDRSTGARRCQGRIGPSVAQISKRFRSRPETPNTVKINFIYNKISLERGPEDESGPWLNADCAQSPQYSISPFIFRTPFTGFFCLRLTAKHYILFPSQTRKNKTNHLRSCHGLRWQKLHLGHLISNQEKIGLKLQPTQCTLCGMQLTRQQRCNYCRLLPSLVDSSIQRSVKQKQRNGSIRHEEKNRTANYTVN